MQVARLSRKDPHMIFYLGAGFAVVGFAFILGAGLLSHRYDAWTTRLRERHPNINPPPTPEDHARNIKVMKVMFRFVGILLILLANMYVLQMIPTKPH
jgi:hypothetical protein